MKPYLLSSNYKGCSYVRIWQPAWANKWMTNRPSLKEKENDYLKVVKDIIQSDILVVHRPEILEYKSLIDLARQNGKKIVIDNDDTFYIDDNHPLIGVSLKESETLKDRINLVNEFIKTADLVTCSTDTLNKEYSRLNNNVVTLPNCINPSDWPEPVRNENGKVRIGLVGSVSMEYDYLHVKGVIRALGERNDVELVLIGLGDTRHRKDNKLVERIFKNEYKFWDSIHKEHLPWCQIEDYPDTLNKAKLDLMLIPRKDNYFNRCKSNLKFLEASMLEIPVVAQSFKDAPYEELTPHIGVLVKDNKNWLSEIDKLIKDKHLRRQIGKNAKDYVLKNYNINNNSKKWAEAYQKICK